MSDKKFRTILLAAFFLIAATAAGAKPRLAIRAFENKAGGSVPASAITEMMTTELFNARLFSLMERERLRDVGEEIRLGQSGLVDSSTAPEVGKIRGAQYTLTGAVTEFFYNTGGGAVIVPGAGGAALASNTAYVTLDIRIIDNTTSEVVYAAVERGASNRTLGGAVTAYGGFGAGKTGGILAGATRKAVMKHVESMKALSWE